MSRCENDLERPFRAGEMTLLEARADGKSVHLCFEEIAIDKREDKTVLSVVVSTFSSVARTRICAP